jgi:hypothetical protein
MVIYEQISYLHLNHHVYSNVITITAEKELRPFSSSVTKNNFFPNMYEDVPF